MVQVAGDFEREVDLQVQRLSVLYCTVAGFAFEHTHFQGAFLRGHCDVQVMVEDLRCAMTEKVAF